MNNKNDKLISMQKIKKYAGVTLLFILIAVAVLFRSFNTSGFRYDALSGALPSINGSNLISLDQLKSMTEDLLIIELIQDNSLSEQIRGKSVVRISPESILERSNLQRIRRHKGPVVLTSSDISISSRIWMLLSQKGLKEILILNPEKGFESLSE